MLALYGLEPLGGTEAVVERMVQLEKAAGMTMTSLSTKRGEGQVVGGTRGVAR